MKNRLFLLLLLMFTSLAAVSLPPALDISRSQQHIGKSMLLYEDTSCDMGLSDILQLSNDAFSPLHTDVFSTTFTSSSYWFKFNVNNTTDMPLSRIFVFEPPWLDYVHVHILTQGSISSSYEVGNIFEYSNRTIDHHLINFEHTFLPGTSSIYIQVKTRDPFIVSLSLMEEEKFLLQQQDKSFYIGLIYGVLLAMMLYNFFLFIGIREPYYAYYVLFVTAFLIMNASYNGYTFKPLCAQLPELQNWLQASSIFFYSLTALLFAKSFLNLKKTHRLLNISTLYMIYFLLFIATISAVIGGYHYHVMLSITMSVIVSLYIFFTAIFSWRQGNRSARFFILGFFSGLSGTVITALTVMGQISYHEYTYRALDFGMVIDAILLSLALSDKLKIINEQKLIAEKASKTDILTGLMNRRAYYEISTNEVHRAERYGGKLSLMFLDIDHFKTFNDTHGHDVGDRVLEHFSQVLLKIKRKDDYAFRLGGDEFLLLLPETEKSEAEHLAQRIQEETASHTIHLKDRTLTIRTSYGVAELEASDRSIKEVEKRADRALYKAKESV